MTGKGENSSGARGDIKLKGIKGGKFMGNSSKKAKKRKRGLVGVSRVAGRSQK